MGSMFTIIMWISKVLKECKVAGKSRCYPRGLLSLRTLGWNLGTRRERMLGLLSPTCARLMVLFEWGVGNRCQVSVQCG